MSGSDKKATGFWFCGIVTLGCAGAIAGVCWYRGAINPLAWMAGRKPGEPSVSQSAPPPEKKVEAVLDPELVEAQTEPELDEGPAIRTNAVAADKRRRKGVRSLTLFDELADDATGGTVETANFEEELEAPPPAAIDPPRLSGKTQDGLASAKTKGGPERPSQPSTGAEEGEPRDTPLISLEKIESLESQGDLIAAQRELSHWFWQKPAEREQILPMLNRMARSLYFSPQPHHYEPYVVQPGDQLRVIGQKHKLSWEYLSRLNHVDSRKIRAGQKLKVVPGPFATRISLSRYELVVHLNGSYVKSYRVGVGKDGTTPVGVFSVKNKMIDPTYYGPEGVIAHDDPQNPLGERWIDIGDSFGIHGTIEPASIGKNESRGCIRMLNSDVEEVYDFLVNGSEVRILR
jgi:L,D-transpeptidase catalytic domain/LysM domain